MMEFAHLFHDVRKDSILWLLIVDQLNFRFK